MRWDFVIFCTEKANLKECHYTVVEEKLQDFLFFRSWRHALLTKMWNIYKVANLEETDYWQVFIHHFSATSVPGIAEADSSWQLSRYWEKKENVRFFTNLPSQVFGVGFVLWGLFCFVLHCIWLNDLRIYVRKYFKNYALYLFCLNSLYIILTFCKGQACDWPDSVSLALGCVFPSWQKFQKESWSTSCVCPSCSSAAKHSKHIRQVLGYHFIIRPIRLPFSFVNVCFCCRYKSGSVFLK